MRIPISAAFAVLLTSQAATAAESSGDWQESVLSAATLEKVYAASGVYHRCIGEQLQAYANANGEFDSRAIADAILKKCEVQLQPMREAFTAEKVPEPLADRYLHRTRTQAARNLIRKAMAMQAMRGG